MDQSMDQSTTVCLALIHAVYQDSFISALIHSLRVISYLLYMICACKYQRYRAIINLQFHGFQQSNVAPHYANLTSTYDKYRYWYLQIERKSTAWEVMHYWPRTSFSLWPIYRFQYVF